MTGLDSGPPPKTKKKRVTRLKTKRKRKKRDYREEYIRRNLPKGKKKKGGK